MGLIVSQNETFDPLKAWTKCQASSSSLIQCLKLAIGLLIIYWSRNNGLGLNMMMLNGTRDVAHLSTSLACPRLWVQAPAPLNRIRWHMSGIPALGRQKDQKPKDILSFVVSSGLTWAT